nr:NUDIX hydrolase [Candidatus Njordarchaeota archaeon]
MVIKREYPNAPVVAVAALILDKGRLLLVRRKNEPSQGLWSAPGGLVELNERTKDAVRREVEEETGIRVEVDRLLTVADHIIKNKDGHAKFHYIIIYYLAHPAGGTLRASTDAEDARWIPLDEVKNLPASRTFISLIEGAKRKRWLRES